MMRRAILAAMLLAAAWRAGPAALGAAAADRPQRPGLFLRPAGQARVAGRGEHLHDHDGPRAAPPAVPLPRHAAGTAAAGAELAGLGRAGAARRADRHQRPCREGRRRDPRRAGRPARVRRQAGDPGRALRPRPAAHRRQRREVPLPRDARFQFDRGRRHRAGDRQSVRPQPDRDQRHHLGAGALAPAASTIRASSSRPTPPSIPATPAAPWSASTGG